MHQIFVFKLQSAKMIKNIKGIYFDKLSKKFSVQRGNSFSKNEVAIMALCQHILDNEFCKSKNKKKLGEKDVNCMVGQHWKW